MTEQDKKLATEYRLKVLDVTPTSYKQGLVHYSISYGWFRAQDVGHDKAVDLADYVENKVVIPA